MRLDKYLKVSRLMKRRTVANEACDSGRVTVNGKAARASYEIKPDDVIAISLGAHTIRAKVLSVDEYATKAGASSLYEVISEDGPTA